MAPGRRKRTREGSLEALPPIFSRRGWKAADFRTWGQGRVTLRDPAAAGWPDSGERTTDYEVAVRWILEGYLPLYRDQLRRKQLHLPPSPRRLATAAEAWIEAQKRAGTTMGTWHTARSALNHLRLQLGDDFRTDGLTTPTLQGFFDELVAEGYAPNTLHSIRKGISNFLEWIATREVSVAGPSGKRPRRRLRNNAALAVELPDVVHQEVHPWTPAQLEAIRTAADALDQERKDFRHHRLAIELGLSCGARRNELFALTWPQINPDARTIRITQQVAKTSRELVPLESKLSRTALLLPDWWPHHVEGATGLVLPSPAGALVHPRLYTLIRQRILQRAEVYARGIGWHKDRHTYSFDFIVLGGRFEELQKSLGHSSITTTETLYGHFHADVAAELARRRIYREDPLQLVR